jgi:hypothetical protein
MYLKNNMHLTRLNIIFALLISVLSAAYSQDSLQYKPTRKFGATYNVAGGLFYSHAIGAFTTIRDKHQIELTGLIIPGINPFKDKMNFGASLNYNYLPNKADNLVNLSLNPSLYFTNFSGVEEYTVWPNIKQYRSEFNTSSISFLTGLGFDSKLSKNIHISLSVSSYIIGYGIYKAKYIDYINNYEYNGSHNQVIFLKLDNFSINDLLAKIGIKYYLKS